MESVLWVRFSDQNLAKETIDDLLCERLLKLVKLNKNVSYNKEQNDSYWEKCKIG